MQQPYEGHFSITKSFLIYMKGNQVFALKYSHVEDLSSNEYSYLDFNEDK